MINYSILREDIVGREPGNILAQMFRQIVRDMNLLDDMEDIIENRLEEMKKGGAKVSKGTINSKVLSEDMSFKVFIDLLINLLKLDEVEFSTACTLYKRKSISTVKVGIRR